MIPLAPPSPHGYPSAFWSLEVLKVFGFTLHMGPMNLWYAGAPLAFLLALFGKGHARHLGRRIGWALPVAIALGVNFGIVPLLFTQVVNYQFFYTAGVLIAWPWLSVIGILIVAYYAAYVQSRTEKRALMVASGAAAGGLFVIIGFLFANNFSLMTNPPQWLEIFRRTSVAGSPTGWALNFGDPTLAPRWLTMWSLATTTTAAYIVIDTAVFAKKESEEYRRWAGRFAFALYTFGLVWFAGVTSWYIFGTLPEHVRSAMMSRPLITALTFVTGASPGLPWLLIALWLRFRSSLLVAMIGVAQFGVLGLNAISRQWVQNMELRPYADLAKTPVHLQLGGLIMFLVMFGAAVVFCIWLAMKLYRAPTEREESWTGSV